MTPHLAAAIAAMSNDVEPYDRTTSHVILHDGSRVRVDNVTLCDLIRRGIRGRWHCYSNQSGNRYVAIHVNSGTRGTTTVARMILCPMPKEQVVYNNGDHLDLRRKNLRLDSNRGWGRRRRYDAHAAILFPDDPEGCAKWMFESARKEVASFRAGGSTGA